MKKLVLIFFLLPVQLFAQIDGIVIFSDNARIDYHNESIIEYLTRNINRIELIGGKTEIAVPVYKVFFKNTKTIMVDGYYCQFEDTGKDVTLKKCDAKMIVFDFKNKTINGKPVDKKKPPTVADVKKTAIDQNNDDNDWQKPVDLKNKVKQKNDKLKNKKNKVNKIDLKGDAK